MRIDNKNIFVMWFTLGKLLGSVLGLGASYILGKRQVQDANEFSAQQAQQSWQRSIDFTSQVSEMNKAGLNPALMYGSGVSNVGSTSAPQSVTPAMSDLGSILTPILSALALPSEIKRNEAAAAESSSRATLNTIDSETRGEFNRSIIDRTIEETNLAKEHIATQDSIRRLNEAHISLTDAERTLTIHQGVLAEIDSRYRAQYDSSVNRLMRAEYEYKSALTAKEWRSLPLIEWSIRSARAEIQLMNRQAFKAYWEGMDAGARAKLGFQEYGYNQVYGIYNRNLMDLSRVGLINSQYRLNNMNTAFIGTQNDWEGWNNVTRGIGNVLSGAGSASSGASRFSRSSSYSGWSPTVF